MVQSGVGKENRGRIAMLQIYDKLLELPLFLGIGMDDLTHIVEATKFEFIKLRAGKTVVSENQPCEQLYFLMDGILNMETRADDNSYTMTEEMKAPAVLQPERLFGLRRHYSKSFRTKTTCGLLSIEKSELLKLLDEHFIFRLNYYNLLCTRTQRAGGMPWRRTGEQPRDKFTRFVSDRSDRPAGRKELCITMQQLANAINESRLNTSRMLHDLHAHDLIRLYRSKVIIPHLEKLVQA
ncbi:Crp/Fnr family transcriptional regulator [Prevotella brunnea]|nr:Crp/Fnr family transcriptional regulator [Prevotella brunnea]